MTATAKIQRAVRSLESAAELHRSGNLDAAVVAYRRGLAETPRLAAGHLALGLALASLNQHDDAVASLRRALALDRTLSGAHLALGQLRAMAGDLPAAREFFRDAVRYAPDSVDAASALWRITDDLELLDERVAAGRRYVALKPEQNEARWDLALHELCAGDLQAGWEGYAYRWQHTRYAKWRYPLPYPQWSGEDITGQHVLVWREQGVGDEIMFANCLPDLIARAGKVTFACTSRLVSLFTRSFPRPTSSTRPGSNRPPNRSRRTTSRRSVICRVGLGPRSRASPRTQGISFPTRSACGSGTRASPRSAPGSRWGSAGAAGS